MSRWPAYVILGRGRWAKKLLPIIAAEERTVSAIEETRQDPSEGTANYISRLSEAMKESHAQVAWLCVSPGKQVCFMIEAALEAGLHVVVEKPWYGSEVDTRHLQALARAQKRVVAIHFEYLVHTEVQDWKKSFYPGTGMRFGGHFFLSRPDHTGIPPRENLGSHLMAICEFAVPAAELCELQCAYEHSDERIVWLERGGQPIASIDLLKGSERIIQDFIKKVEAALDGAAFPFDLDFALRVANQLNAFKAQSLV